MHLSIETSALHQQLAAAILDLLRNHHNQGLKYEIMCGRRGKGLAMHPIAVVMTPHGTPADEKMPESEFLPLLHIYMHTRARQTVVPLSLLSEHLSILAWSSQERKFK